MSDAPGRELLVLRHAKSAWDTGAPTDAERPLAPRGERDAPRMGRYLAEQGLVPDAVLSSPATRAKETAKRVLEAMDADPEEIRYDERIYDASTGELLRVLADVPPGARRVMLVGHNPALEDLVRWLAAETPPTTASGKLLPTCTVAHLDLPGRWDGLAPGTGRLRGVVRPKELDD